MFQLCPQESSQQSEIVWRDFKRGASCKLIYGWRLLITIFDSQMILSDPVSTNPKRSIPALASLPLRVGPGAEAKVLQTLMTIVEIIGQRASIGVLKHTSR